MLFIITCFCSVSVVFALLIRSNRNRHDVSGYGISVTSRVRHNGPNILCFLPPPSFSSKHETHLSPCTWFIPTNENICMHLYLFIFGMFIQMQHLLHISSHIAFTLPLRLPLSHFLLPLLWTLDIVSLSPYPSFLVHMPCIHKHALDSNICLIEHITLENRQQGLRIMNQSLGRVKYMASLLICDASSLSCQEKLSYVENQCNGDPNSIYEKRKKTVMTRGQLGVKVVRDIRHSLCLNQNDASKATFASFKNRICLTIWLDNPHLEWDRYSTSYQLYLYMKYIHVFFFLTKHTHGRGPYLTDH